jgi:hypothetical protein
MSDDGLVLVSAPCSGYKCSNVAEDSTASIFRDTELAQVDAESEGITFLQSFGTFITSAKCRNPKG